MASFRLRFRKLKQAVGRVMRVANGLTPSKTDMVIRKASWIIRNRMILQTPRGYTGYTRKSWTVQRKGPSHYSVINLSKVMNYLEHGTQDHGPVTAKALFIPLNRKAAWAGPRGVMNNPGGFKVGRDYIWAKRVKGIKALRIAEKYTPLARNLVKAAMRLHLRKLINS